MEHNLAYSAAQTENEAYGAAQTKNEAYGTIQTNTAAAQDIYDDLDNLTVYDQSPVGNQSAPPASPVKTKKGKVTIGILCLLSILAMALAVAAIVLSVAHFTTDSNQPTLGISQEDIQAMNDSIVNVQQQLGMLRVELMQGITANSESNEAKNLLLNASIQGLTNQVQELQVQQGTLMQSFKSDIQFLNDSVLSELSNIKQDISTQAEDISMLQTVVQSVIGSQDFPASSCSDITVNRPSGMYWIQTDSTSSPIQVYCDTNRPSCSCNSDGGWARIANIDMTDFAQSCPAGFRLITSPRRTCGSPHGTSGCVSTTFPTYGIEYSRVCGRVLAYQVGAPIGFNGPSNIDSTYIGGVSLTHRQPRQHIWSFVNAVSDGYGFYDINVCPCTRSSGTWSGTVHAFMGQDYFCDSGVEDASWTMDGVLFPDDPLWDGAGCGGTSTCCVFNTPPWFCKQLPQPTTDDIELRLCHHEPPSNDDSPIEVVELYIN